LPRFIGFRQVAVGAALDTASPRLEARVRGREEEDRDLGREGIGLETMTDLEAVEVGEMNVENDSVGT
jgi:hypothetical protein